MVRCPIGRYSVKFLLFLFCQIGTDPASNHSIMYHSNCSSKCPTDCLRGWYYWVDAVRNKDGWINADDGWRFDDYVKVLCGRIFGIGSKLLT